jgi:hypothetical protein
MPYTIKRHVFAHSFVNPPSREVSCDISLVVSNARGKFNLSRKAPAGQPQTRYELTVLDPSILRIASSSQVIVERATDNLVLACNLALKRVCLSTLQGDLSSSEISHSSESKVTVEETPKGKQITISETLSLNATVHITLGISEELDEEKVIALLGKVIRVNRFEPKTLIVREANLSKALNEYENAMFSFSRLRIFKYLFQYFGVLREFDWYGL